LRSPSSGEASFRRLIFSLAMALFLSSQSQSVSS
jgi:hypothetical protein